jgi:hypothetical protein
MKFLNFRQGSGGNCFCNCDHVASEGFAILDEMEARQQG